MMLLAGSLHATLHQMRQGKASFGFVEEATVEGLQEAKRYWIAKVLLDHFATYAAAKYGFARRSPKYQEKKETKIWMKDRFLQIFRPVIKPAQELVLFGDLKQALEGRSVDGYNADLTASPQKTELVVKVRSPHPMRGQQWVELKFTLPHQERAMSKLVVERFTRRLADAMPWLAT